MKKVTYLNWHLGLGDAFICNGLVHALHARGEKLILPAKPHNVNSVEDMFRGMPNVMVMPVTNEISDWKQVVKACKELGLDYLGLGTKTMIRYPGRPWDLEFYDQARVPIRDRWDRFLVPFDWQTDIITGPYAFVHDDPSRGFVIKEIDSELPVRTPGAPHEPIGIAARIMANATEIHCIDSSFLNLAEGMHAQGWLRAKRFVWHKYARPGGCPPQALRAPWEIIE